MNRRNFLLASVASIFSMAAPTKLLSTGPTAKKSVNDAVYLIPGYRTDIAFYNGEPAQISTQLRQNFPKGYTETTTLVTRIDESTGSTTRALMPIIGHQITVSPNGRQAFWNSMNGNGLLTFDPHSLELDRLVNPGSGWIGGGHAQYTNDSSAILVTERRKLPSYYGKREQHFGRITLRDAKTLQVLDKFSSQGIAPHDIALIDEGNLIAIAHYGTVPVKTNGRNLAVIEPSLCLLETTSGKLVHKWTGESGGLEIRHLAADADNLIAAILIRQASGDQYRKYLARTDKVMEFDYWANQEEYYLPSPVGFYNRTYPQQTPDLRSSHRYLGMRQGQSIIYDGLYHEFIATFASSHEIIIFSAKDGGIKQIIDGNKMGLRYPRGVVLHSDGIHYAVSGGWQNIFLFRRGSHELEVNRTLYTVLFNHSHLSIS